MSLENIIKSLENGICPLELNYKPCEGGENIDWNRVLYNLRYKQPEFYEQKFPPECAKIPAFDEVINLITEKNYQNSPLKEILQRQDEMIALQDNNKIEIKSDASLHE
jgi:hypothetical protein